MLTVQQASDKLARTFAAASYKRLVQMDGNTYLDVSFLERDYEPARSYSVWFKGTSLELFDRALCTLMNNVAARKSIPLAWIGDEPHPHQTLIG
jgi:hypothetical protein